MGNLPFDIEEEELWQLFQEKCAGSPPLKSIRVLRNPKTNKGKGIAFVEFQVLSRLLEHPMY